MTRRHLRLRGILLLVAPSQQEQVLSRPRPTVLEVGRGRWGGGEGRVEGLALSLAFALGVWAALCHWSVRVSGVWFFFKKSLL